jgi:hypothetical protein
MVTGFGGGLAPGEEPLAVKGVSLHGMAVPRAAAAALVEQLDQDSAVRGRRETDHVMTHERLFVEQDMLSFVAVLANQPGKQVFKSMGTLAVPVRLPMVTTWKLHLWSPPRCM